MSDQKERYDAFAVPRNFGEDGVSFNGLSRRKLVEGCILAAGSGLPIIFYLPGSVSLKIILLCFVSLPIFFIGLVAQDGATRYFVVVEDTAQIPLIKGEQIHAFALLDERNTVKYFSKEL